MSNIGIGGFGSVNNLLMSGGTTAKPEVGMGVTELCWTDRHAYTIVEVRSETTLVIQQDHAKRVDTNGMSESQSYEFTPNPDAPYVIITKRRNGKWVRRGDSMNRYAFAIGYRSEYHDYGF